MSVHRYTVVPKADKSTLQRALHSIASSLPDPSRLAEISLARDIEELSPNDEDPTDFEPDENSTSSPLPNEAKYSLVGSYRRSSFSRAGSRGIIYDYGSLQNPTEAEWITAFEEERKLLRDNYLVPTERKKSRGGLSFGIPFLEDHQEDSLPSESQSLLGDRSDGDHNGRTEARRVSEIWTAAVEAHSIHTTWQREAKVLARYSLPLMLTFILQYSLTVASIFAVGRIGKTELGAVSLGAMSANMTGYAIYQGLATSLDTLCAQAYGSGHKTLVGVQIQRMVYFLWLITLPIGLVWFHADKILTLIIPEHEVSRLAGLYLKIVLAGAPGYAAFEAGKRYVQAQGLFNASLCVLMIVAPLNALMNWFFVWHMNLGFRGAPLSVAISQDLLPICLLIYVRFISKSGMSCWGGFSRKAFTNWSPMISLAIPGMIMVEAEMLAFEAITFAASFFGSTVLAAQSIIATISSMMFQVPFPLSVAGSTRVANLIGATLSDAARTSTRVTFIAASIAGLTNASILSAFRQHIPYLFTDNEEVITVVSAFLPLCAAFQLFDALAACGGGILRGLGRQSVGGAIQVFSYYVIGLPISFSTAFGLGWGLQGLWTGLVLALGTVAVMECAYLYALVDWDKSVEEARVRNTEC